MNLKDNSMTKIKNSYQILTFKRDKKMKREMKVTEKDLIDIIKLEKPFAHNCKCSKRAKYELIKFNFENYWWEQSGFYCEDHINEQL